MLQLVVAAGSVIAMTGAWLPLLAGQATTPPAATPNDAKSSGYNLEIVDGKLILPTSKVEATLGNVIDALREQYTEANIVLAPGLAKLRVADLKLRAGRLMDELEGLRVATGGKFEIQGPTSGIQRIDPNTGLPIGDTKQNAGLFVLRDFRPVGPTERTVEAFNIGPYLDWLRHQPNDGAQKRSTEDQALEEIGMIIHDTISDFKRDSDDADRPTWQYHRGATLLVVIGNIESVEIARKIVNALPGMSAIADSARARYGLGFKSPEEKAAEEDAFRARYGLMRLSKPSTQSANTQQGADSSSPADKPREAMSEEAFRKRYGLAPATAPSGQPANAPQEPDTPK